MYCGGRDSVSGSGLGNLAARAARICLSLSSSCIFVFLSSKNANRACTASRLVRISTRVFRRPLYLFFLSFYRGFLLFPGFGQPLPPLGFTFFEFLEDRVTDQEVIPVRFVEDIVWLEIDDLSRGMSPQVSGSENRFEFTSGLNPNWIHGRDRVSAGMRQTRRSRPHLHGVL